MHSTRCWAALTRAIAASHGTGPATPFLLAAAEAMVPSLRADRRFWRAVFHAGSARLLDICLAAGAPDAPFSIPPASDAILHGRPDDKPHLPRPALQRNAPDLAVHDLLEAISENRCAGADAALLDALRLLLADTQPSPHLFLKLARIGDARLFRILFEVHGGDAWSTMMRRGRISVGPLISSRNLPCLRVLIATGFDLSRQWHLLIDSALKADDGAALAFLRDEAGYRGAIFKAGRLSRHILSSGPGIAPWLLAEMGGQLRSPVARSHVLEGGIDRHTPLKTIAVLIAAGAPIRRVWIRDAISSRLLALIDAAWSAHGRLRLKALEPDLEAMIGRAGDGVFYGLTAADLGQAGEGARVAPGVTGSSPASEPTSRPAGDLPGRPSPDGTLSRLSAGGC